MSSQDLMILIYGITFGILIMIIIYTFIRYIYSREIFYISYCFMQVFSLVFIGAYSGFFPISEFIKEGSLLLATISAIVFAISFYEGKFLPKIRNQKELFLNTFLLNMVILTAFYHYVLFEYLPYTVVYAILFISIIFNLRQGVKPTVVYVIGWSIFCFILFIFDFKTYYKFMGYMDIVLIAFAIEAVLFTISVSYRYGTLQKQIREYEDMLLQQSKLAKTGEMISNITHQFRQPLNTLTYIFTNLKRKYDSGRLDDRYFEKKQEQAKNQIQFLSKTIDDFKEFYIPSKTRESFEVREAIDSVITILSSELKRKDVELNYNFDTNKDIKVYGIKNELSQVVLALLSNSIEAFDKKEYRYINLNVSSDKTWIILKVKDNAGGIKDKDMSKMYEPYFSTKPEGTGIGLYLVKNIIKESFEGSIEVRNKDDGAEFTLYLEKSM